MYFRNSSQTSSVHPSVNIRFFSDCPSGHHQNSRPDHDQQKSCRRTFNRILPECLRIIRFCRNPSLIQHLHVHLSNDHFRDRRIILLHRLQRCIRSSGILVCHGNCQKISILSNCCLDLSRHSSDIHIFCDLSLQYTTRQNVRKCLRHLLCRGIIKERRRTRIRNALLFSLYIYRKCCRCRIDRLILQSRPYIRQSRSKNCEDQNPCPHSAENTQIIRQYLCNIYQP